MKNPTINEITNDIMLEVHSEVALLKEEDMFRYCRMETIGYAQIMDFVESLKKISFTIIEETQ